MTYMIEGGSSTTHSKSKRWLYTHVDSSHQLLQRLTDVIVEYLIGQVQAGAQVWEINLFNCISRKYIATTTDL